MAKKDGADSASATDTGATDMAALIADLEAGKAGEDSTPAKGAKPTKKPAGQVIGEEEEGDDEKPVKKDDDDEGEEADEDAEADEDGDDEKPAKKKDEDGEGDDLDPATRRKLAVVQKAEKRHKEQVEKDRKELAEKAKADRAELDTELAKWKPRIEQVEKVEAAIGRAKRDPVGLLVSLGFTKAEIEDASKQAYLYAAGDKDPKAKAAAERLQREREQADDSAALRKRLEQLEQERATEKQQAALATKRESFTDQLVAAVKAVHEEADDKTDEAAAPVVMKLLAKNPAKTRARLFAIADELGQKTGEPPDAEDVIALLEKRERAELEDRGIDLATYLGAAAPAKKPGKTLGKNGGGGKGVKSPKSEDEVLKELERELAEGRHLTGG